MRFRSFRRVRVLAVSLTTATAATTMFAVGMAGTASAASGNGCPSTKTAASLKTASNVAASFSTTGTTTTYKFSSLTDENPAGGVPGLMKYCVYPTAASQPATTTVAATGFNGAAWNEGTGSNNFGFVRPGGDKSNIPLDGKTTTMGTATWSTVPTDQAIVLHINDPTVCTNLYGGTAATCFVKPLTGPICDHGDTNVAYNAMPFDVVDCYTAALGFEAQSTAEFGDEVTLGSGAGTFQQVSLKVLFASYGCSVSGHWYSGDCVSGSNTTFPVDITANIYDPGNLTTPIATVTNQSQPIPFRPSADNVNCTGADAGKWFNTAAGRCQNSIGTVVTFNFPAPVTLPSEVVWTVAFNTTHIGYNPIGQNTTCFTSPGGCGYDSLNVGTTSFTNAPYAGTDVSEAQAFQSVNPCYLCTPPGPLQAVTDFTGFRPLGEIITTP